MEDYFGLEGGNNLDIKNEDIYEVRKKGEVWKLSYPDETTIETTFPWYDKDGELKTIVRAHGGDLGKLTESFINFESQEDAIKYAIKVLGAEKVNVIKSTKKGKKSSRKA